MFNPKRQNTLNQYFLVLILFLTTCKPRNHNRAEKKRKKKKKKNLMGLTVISSVKGKCIVKRNVVSKMFLNIYDLFIACLFR